MARQLTHPIVCRCGERSHDVTFLRTHRCNVAVNHLVPKRINWLRSHHG